MDNSLFKFGKITDKATEARKIPKVASLSGLLVKTHFKAGDKFAKLGSDLSTAATATRALA